MNEICRACGKVIDICESSSVKNLCQSCKLEFEKIEATIFSEGNGKYLKHCSYCGRPFAAFSYFTYSTGKRVKRLLARKKFVIFIIHNV